MLSWDQTPSLVQMQSCRAWVEINLAALRHNVRQFRQWVGPKTDLMAVVKADAYGHGSVVVAKTALQAGASWLGVATVPEGIELRQAGIQAPILVMGAVNHPEEVRAIAAWHLQPTLVTPKQALIFSETLQALSQHKRRQRVNALPVHLKLDTGMSRLGVDWRQALEFVEFVSGLGHVKIASLYSHFATADSADLTFMREQHRRFESAIATLKHNHRLPPKLHLANTAATLVARDLHYDMVRVGLGLHGIAPAPHLALVLDLKPVLEVKARITHVKALEAGTGVSYGHTFVAPQDMTLAVVGIGYADGVPRLLSNQMQVLINGQSIPQVGSITMDQLMLDVSTIPNLQEGDVVTLLGQSGASRISADDWANQIGTISWEILCGFKHRLPRIAVNSTQPSLDPTSKQTHAQTNFKTTHKK
jgi:alanine racemase